MRRFVVCALTIGLSCKVLGNAPRSKESSYLSQSFIAGPETLSNRMQDLAFVSVRLFPEVWGLRRGTFFQGLFWVGNVLYMLQVAAEASENGTMVSGIL